MNTITIDRELFDEMLLFLNIYHLLHEEPCDKFNQLMTKLDQYDLKTEINSNVLVGVPSSGSVQVVPELPEVGDE